MNGFTLNKGDKMNDGNFGSRLLDRAGAEVARLAHDEGGMSTAEYSGGNFYNVDLP